MSNRKNQIKQRSCIICGHECLPVFIGLFDDRFGVPGTYDIVQCQKCGLEQTWPQPSASELKLLYEQFYNCGGEQGTAYTKAREWFLSSLLYQLWLKWEGDICFHLRKGTGRLLDVGCNEGRGLTFYSRNGFQAEGLEINERAAALARQRGFKVYTCTLDQVHPAKPYDVVVLSHVLEHYPNPIETLTKIRRLLMPNGQVWISCPNAASYWRKLFGPHWINWHVPYHLWHFSEETLTALLAKAGLQPVAMETCSPAAWIAQSICSALGSRKRRTNRWMRSAYVVGAMMLAIRGLVLPLLPAREPLAEDCLMVTAIPR